MRKIRIFGEYTAAFLIIFLLLFTIASVVVVKFYGNDLRNYTMDLVNDQLDTKFSVDDLGISIFRRFPNTSVFLNNVTVWSGHNFDRNDFQGIRTDTLFSADRLYIEFNLFHLLHKKFAVKGLEARQGVLNLFIDSTGTGNYDIVKSGDHSPKSRQVDIKGFAVRGVSFRYINKAKSLDAEGKLKEVFMEGNFDRKNYMLKAGGDAFVDFIYNHNVKYLAGQDLKLDLSLQAEDNFYHINKGAISVGELSAEIQGSFLLDINSVADLDLHFKGKRIDLGWISGIISSSISSVGISGSGNADLTVDVVGLMAPTLTPHIEASFSTENADFSIRQPLVKFSEVRVSGTYNNGAFNSIRSTEIRLSSFAVKVGNSTFTGDLELQNLLSPSFTANIRGELFAEEISDYFPEIPLEIHHAILNPDLLIRGSIEGMADLSKKINFTPSGSLAFHDLTFSPRHKSLLFQSVEGIATLTNSAIEAELTGKIEETDFRAHLSVSNPFTSVGKDDPIDIKGLIQGENLNIDQFIAKSRGSGSGEKVPIEFPENVRLDLDFQANKVTKGAIRSEKVSGSLLYHFPALYIDPMHLETMEGVINSKIQVYDLDKPVRLVRISSNFQNVEIRDIFSSFNNFGQVFITEKNIAGRLSGDSEFIAEINDDFTLSPARITSENSLVIENGELIDFQPLIEVSRFLKIDRMDHVRFSTLQNTILINDNQVTIPQMEINSSALNIQASGFHRFDNTFEYHLATRLSEILFNKAQSAGDSEFSIALDKEDKRTIFLKISDDGDGVAVDFDEVEAMKKIRKDLKEEKLELKNILRDEFSRPVKVSGDTPPTEKQNPAGLKFEFMDENPADTANKASESKRRWRRSEAEDKKVEFEFVLD